MPKSKPRSMRAGVLNAVSSCSTKLARSEPPDSLSFLSSLVKSNDRFVSSSESVLGPVCSPSSSSAWLASVSKSCAWKTGTSDCSPPCASSFEFGVGSASFGGDPGESEGLNESVSSKGVSGRVNSSSDCPERIT